MEVAETGISLAVEGCLGGLAVEHRKDLLIGNIAHLMVLLNNLAILITNTAIASFHKSVTSIVLSADVAVDTCPSVIAVASVALSHRSIFAPGQRATSYRGCQFC